MKRFAKILSIALSAVLLLGALSMSAGAKVYTLNTPSLGDDGALTIRNAEGVLAVSTSLEDKSYVTGSFHMTAPDTGASSSPQASVHAADSEPQMRPCTQHTVPASLLTVPSDGESIRRRSSLRNTQASNYEVGNEFHLTSIPETLQLDMVCLYIGEHCTVWGAKPGQEKMVPISADNAKLVSDAFDSQFDRVISLFASDQRHEDGKPYWCDVDGDGKVAIMCYDLDASYGKTYKSYTAGYFYGGDLAQQGSSGNVIENVGYLGKVINGIDCLHLDTFPLMGRSKQSLYSNVEDSYSTLTHEFQHMLNYSSGIWDLANRRVSDANMSTYLNEAFSMAAEHLIWTPESTAARVTYMTNGSYEDGTSLTYWGSQDEDGLSQYSLGYLLGQYLRTRYAQKTNTDGSGVYKEILKYRKFEDFYSPNNEFGLTNGLMDEIASEDILDAGNAIDLISDFWTTLQLVEPGGTYSFDGEDWISTESAPLLPQNTPTTGTQYIYNGSAKYYVLDPEQEYTITSAENVRFITFTAVDHSCGEDLNWYISDDILHIEGTGAMTSAPWQEHSLNFIGVELPEGLTALWDGAFSGYELDYVSFGGTKAAWDQLMSHLGSGNSAIANAPTKYFDSDFVRAYQYNANSKDVSLRLITDSQSVAFAAARFAANGRFLGYAYLAPNLKTNNDGEYGGSVHFNINGAKEFRVMAFTGNGCPNDSARTFQLP